MEKCLVRIPMVEKYVIRIPRVAHPPHSGASHRLGHKTIMKANYKFFDCFTITTKKKNKIKKITQQFVSVLHFFFFFLPLTFSLTASSCLTTILSAISRTLVMAERSCLAARTIAVFSPTALAASGSLLSISVNFSIAIPENYHFLLLRLPWVAKFGIKIWLPWIEGVAI